MGMRVLSRLPDTRCSIVDMAMHVPNGPMSMRVDVEVAASPTNQQSYSQAYDENPDEDFRGTLRWSRQIGAEEHDGYAECKEGCRVPQAPRQTQQPGELRPVPLLVQQQGRYGSQMIGVGGVAQPE